MKRLPLEFAVGFEAELLEAHQWYRERSPNAANRFIDEVERAMGAIQKHPTRWPILGRAVRRYLLRRFPYSVVYRVDESRILIVAISHGARRSGYWRSRLQ